MRMSHYLMFLAAICLPLYVMGYQNIVQQIAEPRNVVTAGIPGVSSGVNYTPGKDTVMITCKTGDTYCQQQPGLPNILWAILVIVGGATILTALVTGFAAMYIIPMFLLMAFINFVILPYSFITDSGMPETLAIPLVFIFNLITVIAVVDFIRGGA